MEYASHDLIELGEYLAYAVTLLFLVFLAFRLLSDRKS